MENYGIYRTEPDPQGAETYCKQCDSEYSLTLFESPTQFLRTIMTYLDPTTMYQRRSFCGHCINRHSPFGLSVVKATPVDAVFQTVGERPGCAMSRHLMLIGLSARRNKTDRLT